MENEITARGQRPSPSSQARVMFDSTRYNAELCPDCVASVWQVMLTLCDVTARTFFKFLKQLLRKMKNLASEACCDFILSLHEKSSGTGC